jgi:hypothetical protein
VYFLQELYDFESNSRNKCIDHQQIH